MEDVKYTWDLSTIVKDEKEFLKLEQEIENTFPEYDNYVGHLLDSVEGLENFLKLDVENNIKLDNLYVYAQAMVDLDAQNELGQKLQRRVKELLRRYNLKTTFAANELAANEETLKTYEKESDYLKTWHYYFETLMENKKHRLSDAEEAIISSLASMGTNYVDAYATFTNLELGFDKIKDESGNVVEVNESEASKFFYSTDRRVRSDASSSLQTGYAKYQNTLATMLTTQLNTYATIARLRNYDSALESAMDVDHLKPTLYHNLIKVVHRYLPYLHHYFKLRKERSGYSEFHLYDKGEPFISTIHKKYTIDEAIDEVLESLKPLGETYVRDLKKGYDSRWIDGYPHKGKRGGAYSWGTYATHPMILLNFTNQVDDVRTLAHESGHSMHRYYSYQNNPYQTSSYTTFLAEIASTVNELLLLNYQLEHAESKEEKCSIVNDLITRYQGTLFTQTMFAEFELWCYEQIEQGLIPTAGDMNQKYMELLKLYYGDSVTIDEYYQTGWSRIPHFYRNFYVYKYATGISIATSFTSRILIGKENALENYYKFLKAGNQDYSDRILKESGICVEDEQFIIDALDYFKKQVEILEDLVKE